MELTAFGSILTQRTSWRNAEMALKNLKNANLLSINSLYKYEDYTKLSGFTKPAGFHQTKPKRLVEFSKFIKNNYDSMKGLSFKNTEALRKELLNVYGIGPETADTILLYALEKPSFIIDAYTRRWLGKNNYLNFNDSYDNLKDFFEKSLDNNLEIYQNLHIFFILDQIGEKNTLMEII